MFVAKAHKERFNSQPSFKISMETKTIDITDDTSSDQTSAKTLQEKFPKKLGQTLNKLVLVSPQMLKRKEKHLNLMMLNQGLHHGLSPEEVKLNRQIRIPKLNMYKPTPRKESQKRKNQQGQLT